MAQQEFLVKHCEEALDIIRDAAASTDSQPQMPGLGPKPRQLANCMVILLCILLTQNPEKSAKHCMRILSGRHPAFVAALQKALDHLLGFDLHSGEFTRAGVLLL